MPLIGVTPWFDYDKHLTYIKKGYCEGIMKAGGMPVLLPLTTDEEILSQATSRCDGFLLSGGPDIDPKYYGENNMVYNGEISPYRDVMEVYIVRKAIENEKPVLGICRGLQIMNAALGGTLYQDILTQMKESAPLKHSQEAPRWYPTHDILIERNTRVWSWFEQERAGVNSFHHQAVKEVAPGFKVTSRAADGVIESIEHETHRFAVGVQWHPELMWQEDLKQIKIFEDFVRVCIS